MNRLFHATRRLLCILLLVPLLPALAHGQSLPKSHRARLGRYRAVVRRRDVEAREIAEPSQAYRRRRVRRRRHGRLSIEDRDRIRLSNHRRAATHNRHQRQPRAARAARQYHDYGKSRPAFPPRLSAQKRFGPRRTGGQKVGGFAYPDPLPRSAPNMSRAFPVTI